MASFPRLRCGSVPVWAGCRFCRYKPSTWRTEKRGAYPWGVQGRKPWIARGRCFFEATPARASRVNVAVLKSPMRGIASFVRDAILSV